MDAIAGLDPRGLSELVALQKLDISSNKFTGYIEDNLLGTLKDLVKIDVFIQRGL